jgi:hypothetical protein
MGKPPVVLYPGECWYGGCCVAICPRPGAIELRIPLANRVHWKSKPRKMIGLNETADALEKDPC